MASSNRHWPSMFKSKPCNAHHQWQHDINAYHQRTPYASGCEERSPEPKPRWNPKPEQIRILEAIFNSGMVNPPRDEIRRIRAQLQEYGQVGDANVFYWFQNRKSRSKNKQRHLQGARLQQRPSVSASPSPPPVTTKPAATAAATSSSSSSSEQTTGSDKTLLPVASMGSALTTTMRPTLPAISMNPMYLHGPGPAEFGSESFLPQGPHGYCFTGTDLMGIVGVPEQAVAAYPGLWGELMGQNQECNSGEDATKVKMQLHHLYGIGASAAGSAATATGVSTASATVTCVNASARGATAAATFASPICEIQGSMSTYLYRDVYSSSSSATALGDGGPATSTVFTNELAFEVAAGPLNIKETFGHEAVLVDHSGHPVLTDEWGVTIHPLQHGACYYLVSFHSPIHHVKKEVP
ncbi:hypothetical protein OPV22_031437 [Ensete ventricosum]|uniref:Homeobox domain-containing protein n=1 Tax=Ensete ventricosum TaxID=4639 RepID=A0AAV8P170_ENSVE|nr:hypothetical protein OPV22_031437 [Ensete ventricosum]